MRNWLRLGYLFPVAIILVWGLAVIINGADTLRETTFTMLMFVGMASSLNILLGYTGYVSFGHIVFFGLGGYFGFFLLAQHDWALVPASLAGGALSAALAGLLGLAVGILAALVPAWQATRVKIAEALRKVG